MNSEELIGKALWASLLAGDALMQVYGTGFEVLQKTDRSPVTEADRQAHQILAFHLSGEIPFLSEEGSQIAFEERRDWNLFWLVDPLDGTKEFIKRRDEFTVNVALIEQNSPVAGVVYLPAKHELFFGGRALGSYRSGGEEIENMKKRGRERLLEFALQNAVQLPEHSADTRGKIMLVQSLSHVTEEEAGFIAELKGMMHDVEAVSAGSSLKFCRVADGSADIYPRFGPTMEWDTAAGQCIAECAGCEVLNVAGLSPIRYNRRALRNDAFIVIGSRIRESAELRNAVLACAQASMAAATRK